MENQEVRELIICMESKISEKLELLKDRITSKLENMHGSIQSNTSDILDIKKEQLHLLNQIYSLNVRVESMENN